MAASSSPGPTLRRGMGFHNAGSTSPRRGRRGSAVTFDAVTSVYPFEDFSDSHLHDTGTLRSEVEEEEDQAVSGKCYACNTLLERRGVRKFFRLCAVLNLLSLAASAPLRVCSDLNLPEGTKSCTMFESKPELEEDCKGVFIQFVVIAVVDLIVAILYTFQFVLRLQYTFFLCRNGDRKKVSGEREGGRESYCLFLLLQTNEFVVNDLFELEQTSERDSSKRNISGLLFVGLIFVSLWYSVAIGVSYLPLQGITL